MKGSVPKDEWRAVLLRVASAVFLSPWTLAFFSLTITGDWWMSGLTYLLLRSFLFDPNGWIAWSVAVLGVLMCAFSIGLLLLFALAAKRARRAGSPYKVHVWPIVLLAGPLVTASGSIAIVGWQDIRAEDPKSARQDLESLIKRIEHKGVWMWLPEMRRENDTDPRPSGA